MGAKVLFGKKTRRTAIPGPQSQSLRSLLLTAPHSPPRDLLLPGRWALNTPPTAGTLEPPRIETGPYRAGMESTPTSSHTGRGRRSGQSVLGSLAKYKRMPLPASAARTLPPCSLCPKPTLPAEPPGVAGLSACPGRADRRANAATRRLGGCSSQDQKS